MKWITREKVKVEEMVRRGKRRAAGSRSGRRPALEAANMKRFSEGCL